MLKKLFIRLLIIIAAAALLVALINVFMWLRTSKLIITAGETDGFDADCILVLGAGVREDGSPSNMLSDRLNTALTLYQSGAAEKIIVSGDHGREDYNEVGTMKKFLTDAGVPTEAVFMDHAGFSTYESMYRAKSIFLAERVIVVTQKYHLYRALYNAQALGLEARGASADLRSYYGQFFRELREVIARCKDFVYCMAKPLPTYLGEPVPVWGDGNVTN